MVGIIHKRAPFDPMTLAVAAALLAAVAFVTCYLPARRAAKVEPSKPPTGAAS